LFEKPGRDWLMYVEDIRSSAEKIVRYTQGLTFEEFCSNTMVYDATLRNFELIGEAANHIPADVRGAHPQISWREMINLRNKCVFRCKLDTDSGANWTLIPLQTGH